MRKEDSPVVAEALYTTLFISTTEHRWQKICFGSESNMRVDKMPETESVAESIRCEKSPSQTRSIADNAAVNKNTFDNTQIPHPIH